MTGLHNVTAEVGLRGLPSVSIPVTVTSPPWDDHRAYGGHSFDFEQVARELHRVTRPGGVVCWHHRDRIVNGSETGTGASQAAYFRSIGFQQWQTITAVSLDYRTCGRRYYRQASQVFVFTKGEPATFTPLRDRQNSHPDCLEEAGLRGDVWAYHTGHRHSTEYAPAHEQGAVMPWKLARDLIRSYSMPGDTVLDVCGGSGTTGVAALLTGRKYLLFEPWEKAYRIAERRLRLALLR